MPSDVASGGRVGGVWPGAIGSMEVVEPAGGMVVSLGAGAIVESAGGIGAVVVASMPVVVSTGMVSSRLSPQAARARAAAPASRMAVVFIEILQGLIAGAVTARRRRLAIIMGDNW
jgi:hypothetical protein